MKLFKKHFVEKPENIVLLVGAVLIALRLIFPVLQCRANTEDIIECPKGAVSFFSFAPDIKYSFHKERTNTQAIALGVLTSAIYIAIRKKKGILN